MRLIEAVDLLNSKELKVQEISDMLGISKDLFSDILKEQGFVYNNSSKLREYIGKDEPEDINLNEIIEAKKNRKRRKNTGPTINKKKKPKNESSNHSLAALMFSDEEIQAIKKLVANRSDYDMDFEITYHFSKLPPKKTTKKASYEISTVTYEAFDNYAKNVGAPRRISRNDMVEIALHYFMKNFPIPPVE